MGHDDFKAVEQLSERWLRLPFADFRVLPAIPGVNCERLWGFHTTETPFLRGILQCRYLRPGKQSGGADMIWCQGFKCGPGGLSCRWNRKEVRRLLDALRPGVGKYHCPVVMELQQNGPHSKCPNNSAWKDSMDQPRAAVHWVNHHRPSVWMVAADSAALSAIWIDLAWPAEF